MGVMVSLFPVIAAAVLFLAAALLYWLWNITMPQVFRLPYINFWQAFRLLLIAALLFGGGFSSWR